MSQAATKSDTAAEIGKARNESRDQVFRYIRLTHLIPELLQKVDGGVIALSPAVELSYLPEEQHLLGADAEERQARQLIMHRNQEQYRNSLSKRKRNDPER